MSEWLKEHAWKAIFANNTSDIKTHNGAFDSATCGDNMLRDVTP
jgi:hypothetical protein